MEAEHPDLIIDNKDPEGAFQATMQRLHKTPKENVTHRIIAYRQANDKTYFTIGDVTINNIENMNSLINALKEATAKVKRLDAEQMTLEEVNEVKKKVNQYISQIDSRKSNEEDKK